ncbi:MAG: thermonuclease family protein [Microbacteriaceae bacterium]
MNDSDAPEADISGADYVPMRRWSEVQQIQAQRASRAAAHRRRRRWLNTLVFVATAGLVVGVAYLNRDALLPAIEDALAAPSAAPAEPPASTPDDAGVASGTIPAGARTATVDYVHDGDTLFIVQNGARLKVRLLGVDTPEVGNNPECYGNEATAFTRSLLPEGSTIFTVADVEPLDKYGRSLLFVYTSEGVLVNQSLVVDGYAEAVFIGGNRMLEREFEAAEDAAQSGGAGIWGACR